MTTEELLENLVEWLKEGVNHKPEWEGTLVDNYPKGYHKGKRSMCYLTLQKIVDLHNQCKKD